MTKKSISLTLLTIAVALTCNNSLSMPPKDGGWEPDYPAGVNSPGRNEVIRDDADLEGEWNCLVLLIDFDDYPWNKQDDQLFPNDSLYYTSDYIESMLFSVDEFTHPESENDFTGSMRDYYLEISDGVFETIGVVTSWYRAPEELSYYCNFDGEDGTDDDHGFGDYPHNVQKLVEDALELADDDVDFADFDNDDDGNVDAIFVVHAGPGAEAVGQNPNYIWSHKWQIDRQERDEVFISTYTMEPEDGTIGVYCHEFGHALGLPDLYDTDYSSEGVGEWCLMSGGGWTARAGDPLGTSPSHMSGWSKWQLDWVEVINVQERLEDELIRPVETDPVIYRLWNEGEDSQEYFLVEFRKRIGFDAGLTRRQIRYDLPAPEGLLITHIDDNIWRNNDEEHRLVDVEEASILWIDGEPFESLDGNRGVSDSNLYLGNRGDNGDLWPGFSELNEDSTDWIGDRDRDAFSYATVPSNHNYAGHPTFVTITDIRFDNDDNIICTFDVQRPDDPVLFIQRVEIDDSDGGNGDGIVDPGETVAINPVVYNIGGLMPESVAYLELIEGEVVVVDDSSSYPRIGTDQSANLDTPFMVEIPDDIAGIERIRFSLNVSIDEGVEMPPMSFSISVTPSLEWFKYPDNPVLSGLPDTWDEGSIFSPALLILGDSLMCWYVSGLDEESQIIGGSVGLAWSYDGGLTWDRHEEPILEPDDADWLNAISGISVITAGENYAMALLSADTEDSSAVVGMAFSEDGVEWVLGDSPIIVSGDGWTDEIFVMGQLSLFPIPDPGYGLAFTASAAQFPFPWIGVAFSDDLAEWEIIDDIRLPPTFQDADFDAYGTVSPDVIYERDMFTVLYSGFGSDYGARLGMAYFDGNRFERQEGERAGGSILEAGGDGSWGEQWIFGGRLFEWEGEKRLLFSGLNEQRSAVGLARQHPYLGVPHEDERIPLPGFISLESVYPNPFNSSIGINFSLSQPGNVHVGVYDLSGREVDLLTRGYMNAGRHSFVWEGISAAGLPAATGVYLLRIESGLGSQEAKLILIR